MNFIDQIKTISEEYQLNNYNKFNLFQVMFKQHDEKYLHSRFISFLLDPNGSHNQGTKFLDLFFKVMQIPNFSLEGVKVNPNEREREEKYNIDILITNKQKQAVIIENKFFAKDQTKPEETDPFKKYQLLRYYKKIAVDEKFEAVTMIYLSINSKNPEDFEKFPPEVKNLIATKDHLSDLAKWLDLCLEQLTEDSDLKRSILQYKQARFEFLNDVKLALKLKELTVTHFNEAKQFWPTCPKIEIDQNDKHTLIKSQFIHVKWHTVHEFFTVLTRRINEEFKVDVTEVDKEKISAVTHRNTKTPTLLTFQFQDVLYYVCNDKNGFSIGRHIENKSEDDFQILFDKNHAFFDFKKPEVFQLIKPNESEKLAGEIVNALKNFINK